jgi:hypothetical protein
LVMIGGVELSEGGSSLVGGRGKKGGKAAAEEGEGVEEDGVAFSKGDSKKDTSLFGGLLGGGWRGRAAREGQPRGQYTT